ncbi:glycoside hydrolase family 6 protein [Catellatospora methionotrophica]|uniref:glycoside hydrolase family 6 protein n=1 Tax=Catellatospora methionotrophica TaxID=121620 RepID=UPI00140B3B2C|nr:glycoside hydrolase family 6 protein [Catellatospora methionotrophica]
MRFPIRLSGRRKIIALTGASTLVFAGLVTIPAAIAHAAPGCDIAYTTNDWTEAPGSGGFTASITVKNTGDPITSWSLKFAFPAGQTYTQGWSANWSASGANVTGTSLSHNGSLGTGASTSIGFNGRWSGSNPKPTAFTLNNVACTTGGVTPSSSPSTPPSPSTSPSPQTRSIIISPSAVSVAEGSSSSVTVKLSAAPSANVTVALARSGDTSISAPSSVTLTPSNAVAGVSVAIAAAEDSDQTNGTATVAASASGYTGASLAVTEIDNDITQSGKVDNPYSGARGYVNPEWSAKAASVSGGSRVSNLSTAVWLDRIAAIAGTSGSSSNGSMGLADHLDEALRQANAGSGPLTVQFVIYNLPGRDCSALASNGELGVDELPRYKSEYIDPIAAIMGQAKYASLRIVAIIEIDSLPNLVTNLNIAKCATMNSNGGYVKGVGYALNKLGAISNVYNYIDSAHHGWIGWDTNFGPTALKLKEAAVAEGSTVNNVHGFITNTANYSALVEPYFTINTSVGGTTVRQSKWVDWNYYVDEQSFAQAFRTRLVSEGFNSNIGMLIDTSRNGWGGSARPTAASTSTSVDTFVNQSRIDRRIHAGNWCNQSGAGLGERPRANPATGIDAYVWVKPPGESDGSSSLIPNNEGKGFDRMCDPTYTGNQLNGNNLTGALPDAPISGAWFSAQFAQLMANAYPPLS